MSRQEALTNIEALEGRYTFDPALEAEGGPSEIDQYYHEKPTLWENLHDKYGENALKAAGIIVGIGALIGLVDALDGKFNIFPELTQPAEAANAHNQPICTDSDITVEHRDGFNTSVKGTISGIQDGKWATRTDRCYQDTLHEYYFPDPLSCDFDWDKYHCEDDGAVCEDGRCVHKVLLPLVIKKAPNRS